MARQAPAAAARTRVRTPVRTGADETPTAQEEVPLPLPRISQDLGPRERYKAVMAVLAQKEIAWTTLSEHSLFLSFGDGVLKVGFPSRFHLQQGESRLRSASLRPLLEHAFPDLRELCAEVRQAERDEERTRHEVRKEERAAYRAELRRQVERDPVVRRLREALGLRIHEVIPIHREEQSP